MAEELVKNNRSVFGKVVTGVEHVAVGLPFVHLLQPPPGNPDERIEPKETADQLDGDAFRRMAVTDHDPLHGRERSCAGDLRILRPGKPCAGTKREWRSADARQGCTPRNRSDATVAADGEFRPCGPQETQATETPPSDSHPQPSGAICARQPDGTTGTATGSSPGRLHEVFSRGAAISGSG